MKSSLLSVQFVDCTNTGRSQCSEQDSLTIVQGYQLCRSDCLLVYCLKAFKRNFPAWKTCDQTSCQNNGFTECITEVAQAIKSYMAPIYLL